MRKKMSGQFWSVIWRHFLWHRSLWATGCFRMWKNIVNPRSFCNNSKACFHLYSARTTAYSLGSSRQKWPFCANCAGDCGKPPCFVGKNLDLWVCMNCFLLVLFRQVPFSGSMTHSTAGPQAVVTPEAETRQADVPSRRIHCELTLRKHTEDQKLWLKIQQLTWNF